MVKEENKQIGFRLRAKREECGGSSSGFGGKYMAAKLGLKSDRQISNIENGVSRITVPQFYKYCTALRMTDDQAVLFFKKIIAEVFNP